MDEEKKGRLKYHGLSEYTVDKKVLKDFWEDTKMEAQMEGQEKVPCKYCGKPTPMTGTELCDPCWEVESKVEYFLTCVKNGSEIIDKILQQHGYKLVKESPVMIPSVFSPDLKSPVEIIMLPPDFFSTLSTEEQHYVKEGKKEEMIGRDSIGE